MNHFNYFTEIEETFIRRRGKNLLLSPLDWALMESWKERDIPLHIVLRAIEQVFDTHDAKPNAKRTIKSISYCKEEVEAQFAEWMERQAGKGDDASAGDAQDAMSDASIAEHVRDRKGLLEKLVPATEGVLRDALERVLSRIDAVAESFEGPEKAEATLGKLDDIIDEALIQGAAPVTVSEVERQLASYRESMDAESYERTLRLMLLKRLRDESGIPRLSLFYL